MRPLHHEMCTGPLSGASGACFGGIFTINLQMTVELFIAFLDSGGPLVQVVDGLLEQVGVVSWGPGEFCGMVNSPTVYVNVSGFIGWINSNIS